MQTVRSENRKVSGSSRFNLPVWSGWLLVAMLAFLLVAKIAFSLNIWWQIFNYPFQVDDSEGMIVAEVGLMSKGVDLFAPPTRDTFISAPYTLFYYILNWPFLALLPGSFKPGRLISLLATIGIGLIIYKLVTTCTGKRNNVPDRVAALLGAGVWSSLGLVAFWGGTVKPDITALFFSIAGIWLTLRWSYGADYQNRKFFQREEWPLYAAAIALALAAHTKQTAFAAPAAVLCFTFMKRPLAGVKLLAIYLLVGFGPMLVMQLLSNGGFWWHIVTVHELPWSSYNYWRFAGAYLQNYQIFVGLALLFVPFYLAGLLPKLFKKQNPFPTLTADPTTLPVGYAAAALVVTFSAGTYGGNHNHLLEFAAAMSIAVGLVLSRLHEWASNKKPYGWFYHLALLMLAVQVLGMFVAEARVKPENIPLLGSFGVGQAALETLHNQFYDPEWLGLQYRPPQPDQVNGYGRVVQFITNDAGSLIYSDNVSLVLPTGKRIFTTDTFTQTHATRFGRWNESLLVQMVIERKFSVIVLRESIQKRVAEGRPIQDIYLSPALAQAILDNYDLTCPDRASIYEPKDKDKSLRCDGK